jgi:GT2 family glycosyltransferase
MLEHSQREEIGCVGAKLYYPDETVQHAGIIIGLGGYAGHSHKMYPRDNPGYFNRLSVVQNVSAVTAACLMIKKETYLEVGGMDEVKFKVAYNDVDFCLRVREKGYLNIFTPYAEMYHHESISRGYETTPEKMARFQTEKEALSERHKEILANGDPCYNPNLCHDKEDFSIKNISNKR